MLRGVARFRFRLTLTMAAYDLIRLPKLLGALAQQLWALAALGGQVVGNKRLMQWLIPLLSGIAIGTTIAWTVEALVLGRGVVGTYLAPFGIVALLAAVLLKSRVGYYWALGRTG
jgi:hypothetical protein